MTASEVPEPWVPTVVLESWLMVASACETAWTRVFGLTESLAAQNKLPYSLRLGTPRKGVLHRINLTIGLVLIVGESESHLVGLRLHTL
jgi:hypothetical protein